jgi:uncharacterized protein
LELEEEASRLEMAGGEISFEGPVTATVQVVRHLDNLLIKGVARGTMAGECARCLERFQLPLEQEFTVYAERRPDGGVRGLDRELESDQYLCFHDGISLELGNEVREALILGLPIQPLCREDCKGLCAGCGANLNVETCQCAERGRRATAPA